MMRQLLTPLLAVALTFVLPTSYGDKENEVKIIADDGVTININVTPRSAMKKKSQRILDTQRVREPSSSNSSESIDTSKEEKSS